MQWGTQDTNIGIQMGYFRDENILEIQPQMKIIFTLFHPPSLLFTFS